MLWKVISLCIFLAAFCAARTIPMDLVHHSNPKQANQEPGFKATVTTSGITYLQSIFQPIIIEQLKDLKISDIHQHIDTPIGHCDFDVTNIHMNQFDIRDVKIQAAANQGLTVIVTQAFAAVRFDFHYRKSHWPHISDHGTGDVNVGSNTNFLLTAKVVPSGNTTTLDVTIPQFNIDITQFNLHLHGGASWLYNLFIKSFEKAIKEGITKGLHDQISGIVEQEAKKVLSTVDLNIQVMPGLSVDFSFVQMAFGSSYVTFQQLGQFHADGQPAFPETPKSMPDLFTERQDDMIQLFLSDYVLNSAGWSIQQLHLIKYVVTNDLLPEWFPIRLNTKFFCVFLPKLCELYPGTPDMQITFETGRPPRITFDPTRGMETQMDFDAEFQVVNSSTPDTVFTLDLVLALDAHAELVNQTVLTGKFEYKSSTLTFKDSKVGQFDVSQLDKFMTTLIEWILIPFVNDAAAKGFPLPAVRGVTFINPYITTGAEFMLISSKFQYHP